ncbi:hypothetical protein RRG08_062636 [Elysia crispata]|uniref:Uncharacterized protein n=1 Tax=Elysia crispata TaxID=231223 RepID=A0AAE0YYE3_9GAST|nr:hypothetical protein RRG08_062636 [Elysia crispata]
MHITLKRSRYRSCSARKPHLLRRHETLQNASYLSCRSRTSSEIDLSSAEQGRLPGQDVSNLQTGPDLGCHGCQGSVSQTCSTRNPVGQGLSLILNTVSVLTRPALTPRRLHVLDLSGEGAADLASSLSIKHYRRPPHRASTLSPFAHALMEPVITSGKFVLIAKELLRRPERFLAKTRDGNCGLKFRWTLCQSQLVKYLDEPPSVPWEAF